MYFLSFKFGMWSIMDFGFVFGDCCVLEVSYGILYVFDCIIKRLFNVVKDFFFWIYLVVKDCVFVFDWFIEGLDERYFVVEYIWESSILKLKEWNIFEISI